MTINTAMSSSGDVLQAVDFNGTFQTVTYTSTAGQSAAFTTATTMVMLVATTACFIKRGTNPTATTSDADIYLPANLPFFLPVKPSTKVSAIQATAAGSLYISEIGVDFVKSL